MDNYAKKEIIYWTSDVTKEIKNLEKTIIDKVKKTK